MMHSPGIDEKLRNALGSTAVNSAKAVGYVGAGTVEFIVDPKTHAFYFMEMNTRLQVEHPVSEAITGTDLVAWQLWVASGNALPKQQGQLEKVGWAFEARVYAENPDNQFLPDTGELAYVSTPASARVECGVRRGDAVSVFYDPMLAKVVVWAEDRASALNRLAHALDDFHVVGVHTNVAFLKSLARHPEFRRGNVHTGFIEQHRAALLPPHAHVHPDALACACVAALLPAHPIEMAHFRLNHARHVHLEWNVHGQAVAVRASVSASDITLAREGTADLCIPVHTLRWDPDTMRLGFDLGDRLLSCKVVRQGRTVTVFGATFDQHTFHVPLPSYLSRQPAADTFSVCTPMPCRVAMVHVKAHDQVEKGQPLIVLESMKMEHVIYAPQTGTIASVLVKVNELVKENVEVIRFQHEESK